MAMSTCFVLASLPGACQTRVERGSKLCRCRIRPAHPPRLRCLVRWERRTSYALVSAIPISISRVRAAWAQVLRCAWAIWAGWKSTARSDDDALGSDLTRIVIVERKPLCKPPVPQRSFRPAHPAAAPLACCGSVRFKSDGNKGRSFGGVETQGIGKATKNPTEPKTATFARTETERHSEPGTGLACSLGGSHGGGKAL